MKKSHVAAAALLAVVTGGTFAGFKAKQLIVDKYHHAIAKVNAIDGIDAVPLQIQVGLTQTKAATLITISKEKAGVISEVLSGNKDIVVVIDHTFEYSRSLSEPQIMHSAIFDEKTSKLISDSLNVDIDNGSTLQVPAQIVSHHFSDGTLMILGLTDDIEYGDTLKAKPIKFGVSTNSHNDEIKITASGIEFSALNEVNQKLQLEDFTYTWEGSFDNCEPICQGALDMTAGTMALFDPSGAKSVDFSKVASSASAYAVEDHYTIHLNIMAERLKGQAFDWEKFTFNSGVSEIGTTALNQFTDDILKLKGLENNAMASKFAQEMYARLIQSGMTFSIDEASATTPNGKMDSALKISLPANNMPNMIQNPLGVLTVLEGSFSASVPTAEIDSMTAEGTASSFIRSGFAVPANGGRNIQTNITVKGGQATINGQVVSL